MAILFSTANGGCDYQPYFLSNKTIDSSFFPDSVWRDQKDQSGGARKQKNNIRLSAYCGIPKAEVL